MVVLFLTVILVSFVRFSFFSLFIFVFKFWRWVSIFFFFYKKEFSNELLNKLSYVFVNLIKNVYFYNIKFF